MSLNTVVYKSGFKSDSSDLSDGRGVTVGSVIAKLFAIILDHRIALWAEDGGIKATGYAGFKEKGSAQKGGKNAFQRS